MTRNQISYQEHLENVRHNKATEQQQQAYNDRYLSELERHQMTGDTESIRSNRAKEAIQREVNVINDNHYLRQDLEAQRHNIAGETESIRHNQVTEYNQLKQTSVGERQADTQARIADARESEVESQNASRLHQMQMNSLENARAERRLNSELQRNAQQIKLFESQSDLNRSRQRREDVSTVTDAINAASRIVQLFRKEDTRQ